METVLVMAIVAACSGYAAWTLMPTSARRALAAALARLPVPPALRRALAHAVGTPGGCGGCDGCGSPTDKGDAKPITVHRPR